MLISDKPTVDERVGSALADGDTDWRRVDPIAALGIVAITERAVDAIYRFRQGLDSHAHKDAIRAIVSISRSLDARDNWRFKSHETLAAAVLEWWTAPLCPECTGRRFQVVPDTPILGDACPGCSGTGQRAYPWGRVGREARYHTETLWALQEAERRIRNKLIDQLAHEIRDSGFTG